MKKFKVLFRPEPEGGYTASVPSMPICISYGEMPVGTTQAIFRAANLDRGKALEFLYA